MANPNPDQSNLRKFTDMTPEEHRELSKKGNKASMESKRARKSMREMLDYLMEKKIKNCDGDDITTQEAILISMIDSAINKANVKAATFIRDTIGEKPVDKVEFKPSEETLKEVNTLLHDDK